MLKIGTQITENSQHLDLGFKKKLKMSGRNSTSIGSISDMMNTVDMVFKKLSVNKQVILNTCNLSTLNDCIICSPDIVTKSFSTRIIQKAYISSRMLDNKMKRYPDI